VIFRSHVIILATTSESVAVESGENVNR